MTDQSNIVEKLSLFNNMSFTKKQWDIILKGCGCPKSKHLWTALRSSNMQKEEKLYTLLDINMESFDIVWTKYCTLNRENVKKTYYKKKAIKRAKERQEGFKGITLYMINGYLTDIKPTRDEN